MSVHDLGAQELLGALYVMDQLPARVRVIGLPARADRTRAGVVPQPRAAFRGAALRR